ncbi:uncharacterized protein LOC111379688 [Olea europaea var. sylvestris]|uniref:uncharacterized protein LOC111379688 n=1 Tax=Olea europaea var. sylvestris TaxID=158386 RepID=UPI000C1D86AE|nr:uncharacterized protein LOC111379688 [Olea europaea var. sylvestris]
MVQQNQFGSAAIEDPNAHIGSFLEIYDTVKMNGVTEDIWVQIEIFYNGLNGQTKTMVDAAMEGILTTKTAKAANAFLDDIATNHYQWPSERSSIKKVTELHEVDPITALAAQVQYVNSRNYNQRENYQVNHYHPGLRNHENLSYGNNRNTLQPPPGFNTRNSEGKPSLEDVLGTFISKTRSPFNKDESWLDNIETHVSNMGAIMKNLEVQIGQLATSMKSQQQGKFPSDTKVNPKEYRKAVVLRSGKQVGENALEQMPNYAKFMKKVMSKKWKLEEYETVKLTEECDAILQKKLPQRRKDSGSFNILCTIGSSSFNKALSDLKASINLMPLSVFKKLGLEEVKPTTVTL